jgi:hypothetical protein
MNVLKIKKLQMGCLLGTAPLAPSGWLFSTTAENNQHVRVKPL